MPKYKIVVDNPDIEFSQSRLRGHKHEKRIKGFTHVEAIESECPNGLPNCKHCGDSDYLEDCKSKGHCPDCGIKHGIAPESVLIKNGYKLEAI